MPKEVAKPELSTIATRFLRYLGPSLDNLFTFCHHDNDCAYDKTDFCDCGMKLAKDRMRESLNEFYDELVVVEDQAKLEEPKCPTK